jgi:diphthamide biosynthesis protein 4
MAYRMPNNREENLYDVLGLPRPSSTPTFSPSQIKIAFRRTLLKHHPDKASRLLKEPSSVSNERVAGGPARYDVDTICLARDILLDPARRKEYDMELAQTFKAQLGIGLSVDSHPTELETLDLDDMTYDESIGTWSKTCRCGNSKAYEISEEDLIIASTEDGREVLVGCGGCSLFVRVVFEAIDG